MINLVLFDLDGVLVETCEWHYSALNKALKELCNYEISRNDHETKFNGLPTKVKLEILSDEGIIDKVYHNAVWKRKQDVTEQVIISDSVEDVEKIKLHSFLKASEIRLGCVTNSIRRTAKLMLEYTGQLQFIEHLISNEDVKLAKPDPEGYISAMKFFNCSPKNTLIVEDSDKGHAAAVSSGAHVMRVKNCEEVTLANVKAYLEKL